MCGRVILLIGLCVGALGQAPPLRVTSAPNTFDPNCLDKLNNCWDMPESNCRAPYKQWAMDNCANRCGYCIGPTTPKPECKNKLSNCEAYDKSVCSNPDYTKWVSENCRYYCRMCTQEELARMDAMTTTISPQNCKDKVDCRAYGKNACSDTFKKWSQDNCPNYCGYCVGLPTPPPACVDHIPNCKAYDADTCTNPNYKLWAEDNCKKFCGLCGQGTGPTSGGAIPITNSPNIPVPVPGHDTPVITYGPPSPPSPGKRHECVSIVVQLYANVPPVRRQFQASHHHSGQQTDKCWDSNDVDCDSDAPEKTKEPTNTTISTSNGDIQDKDFPGSEFRPRPTPDKNWDSKPSTEAPETTMTTDDMPSEQTMDPLTTVNLTTNPTNTFVPTQKETPTSTLSTSDLTASTKILVTSSTETTTPENTSMVPPLIQSTAVPVLLTTEQLQTSDGSTDSTITTSTSSKPSSTIQTTDKPIVSTDASSTLSTGQPSPPTMTTEGSTMGSIGKETPTQTSQATAPPTMSTADTTVMSASTQTTPSTASSTLTATFSSSTAQSSTQSSSNATPPVMITTMVTSDLPSPVTVTQVPPTATVTQVPPTATVTQVPPTATVTQVPPTNGPVSTSSSVTLSTSSTPPTTTEVCEDTIPNCANYGLRACKMEVYAAWSRAHCARFCEFCIPATLTPFKCENKIPNCREFDGGNLCTDVSYFSWARENCYAYCGFHPCEGTTQPMS